MIKATMFNCDGRKVAVFEEKTLHDVLRKIRIEYEPDNVVEWFKRKLRAGRDGGIVFEKISI